MAAAFPQISRGQTQWSVMNYYVYNNMPYSSVDGNWGGITHLAVGDFHVNADGSVRYIFAPGSYFPEAVATAHANGAKALVVLSDTDGSDSLASAFTNHQAALMNNIASVMSTYGFDGIQVDWEHSFPYSNTQGTLGTFFQALRARLGASALIMADAFPAGGPYGVVTQTQWNSAIGSLDRLAIMTYDITRQVSGNYSWFNSPLYNGGTPDSQAGSVDQSMRLFLGGGSSVPASKLMLGIPFYGFTYSGVSGPRQSAGSLGGQSNYSILSNSYNLSAATTDRETEVPWLPISNGYITFDNEQSVAAKVNYAKSKGLGGWMAFNLSADYVPSHNPQHPLLAAITPLMTSSSGNPAPSPTPGNPTTPGASYFNVISKATGDCMDVPQRSTNPGVQIIHWSCNGGDNQRVQLSGVQGGYKVTAKNSSLQLDVQGGPSATQGGVPVIQWPYWGGTNEIWNFAPNADGSYEIKALSSGKCVDASQQQIRQAQCDGSNNQKWTLVPTS